jgi:hypothetical protein
MTYLSVLLVALTGFASVSLAADLDVTFESSILFSDTNVAPGMSVDKTVDVTNNSADSQNLYMSVANAASTGLASQMYLTVTDNASTTVYHDTFDNFFADSPIFLKVLPPSSTENYIFTAYFATSAGNTYQNTTMSFDLVIGFEGGEFVTDGGGGGGSSSGSRSSEDATPEGLIAGADISVPEFLKDFIAGVTRANAETPVGEVAGESIDFVVDDNQATSTDDAVGTVNLEDLFIPSSENCTFWWLLFLLALSFSWGVIDDKISAIDVAQSKLFIRNAVFSLAYLCALLGTHFFSFLDETWYIFALIWSVTVAFDYYVHAHMLQNWNQSKLRNVYFALTSGVLILTSFLFAFPCIWWPFFCICAVSIVLFVFDIGD